MGLAGKGMGMCKGKDKNKKGLSPLQIAGFVKEQEEAGRLVKRSKQTSFVGPPIKKKMQLPTESIATSKHPFLPISEVEDEEVDITTRKRGPLDMTFKMEARDITNQPIRHCPYANGLPFNLVRSPYWKEMVLIIGSVLASYTSPGYEKVHTNILQKERTVVKKSIQPIRDSWITSGVSIVFDGWKDTRNRPLINVIAMSLKGAMFLRTVDYEGEVKDAQFISRILIESINMVASEYVVQVIIDNAKNYRGPGALVEGRYDHISWTPCTVHSLNLAMQQIDTQIEWVKQIYQEEELQMFVTNHQMSQSIFKTFSKLDLLEVQEALSQMVISNQWGLWKASHSERAQKVKALVLDESWWACVQYVLDFIEPIMTMLQFVDTNALCLGVVYDSMDTMLEKVKIAIQKHENDPIECETLCNKVETIIHHRWEKMTTPLHLLAYALSPRYYSKVLSMPGKLAPYTDEEVANGYKKAFERLFIDEVQKKVWTEFGLFASGRNHSPKAIND